MTTSAEEAMARAKEIAARLSGSAVDTATTTSTTKRKRWGVSADAADSTGTSNAADILPGLSDVAKKLKAGDEPVQRRIWVSTANRPNAHFVKYFKDGDKLKGILDQIPASDKMAIDLKGRGTNPNPILGMPEEPLHVLIEGPPDLVSAAEPLVDKLVSEAESAPLLEDPSAIADKAADALAAAMDAAGNMPDSSAPGYRPAPVAALIHGNTGAAAGNGIYGPAGGGEMLEEQLGAPNGVVGYIIGRGGENITSMQSKTGCKVQIQKEHEMAPGQTQRIITLTATSKEAIDQCRAMIEEMVAERIRQTGSSVSMANAMATPGGGGAGTGGQAAKVHEAIAVGHQLVTMEVPDGEVGLIIGRAGSTIKSIQDRSGANIQIPPAADSNNSAVRTVSITHPHLEGAQMAKQIIEDILASSRSRPAQVPHVTIEVAVRCGFRCVRSSPNRRLGDTDSLIAPPSVSFNNLTMSLLHYTDS
jgi:far upstream element-binding protein